MPNIDEQWAKIQEILQKEIPAETYKTWVDTLVPSDFENNKLGPIISEIMEKMYALEDNIEFIVEEYKKQYPKEVTPQLLAVLHADQNSVDLCSAVDEFYIENGAEYLYLEVETKEIAQLNDNDFLFDVSKEDLEKENYHLGDGNYSYYTKLADTDYYFRFM